jgi:hypothetical protein
MGRTIEKFPLCVKEKGTTIYVELRWIGVLRFFMFSRPTSGVWRPVERK